MKYVTSMILVNIFIIQRDLQQINIFSIAILVILKHTDKRNCFIFRLLFGSSIKKVLMLITRGGNFNLQILFITFQF